MRQRERGPVWYGEGRLMWACGEGTAQRGHATCAVPWCWYLWWSLLLVVVATAMAAAILVGMVLVGVAWLDAALSLMLDFAANSVSFASSDLEKRDTPALRKVRSARRLANCSS